MKIKSTNHQTAWIYPAVLLPLITGCAPGPPPPVGPGLVPGAIGSWLFLILPAVMIAWVVLETVKKKSSIQDKEIRENLHDICNRLEELERQIRHIKNSTQGGNHE